MLFIRILGPQPPALEAKRKYQVKLLATLEETMFGGKSYPKDDVAKVVPETPKFTLRWDGLVLLVHVLDLTK